MLAPVTLLCASTLHLHAQGSPAAWSASATRIPGGAASFQLTVRLAAGWHVYSMGQGPGGPVAMRISAIEPATIVGSVDAPTPMLSLDRSFGIMTETYESTASFRGTVTLPGAHELTLRVRYQACDDRVCLPPTTEDVAAKLDPAVASLKAMPRGGLRRRFARPPGGMQRPASRRPRPRRTPGIVRLILTGWDAGNARRIGQAVTRLLGEP